MTEPWSFGLIPCQINSGLMEIVPFIYGILLLALMLDRYLAAKDTSTYRKSPPLASTRCYLAFYWVLILVSVIPLLGGFVQSWPFPDRYSCQPMDEVARLYGAISGNNA